MERVAGKVALITGAARGQGLSHALRLAEEGADIIAVDFCRQIDSVPYPLATRADLASTVAQVEALDRRIVALEADVRDTDALAAAVASGVAELGRLDIVCANAGIISMGPSWMLERQTWNDIIDTDLTGVWNTARAAIPLLLEQGQGGSLIFTSSSAGLTSIPYASHYSAAKAGVVALARSLAQELGPQHVRVNTVNPSSVDTDMIQNPASYKIFRPDLDHPTREDVKDIFAAQSCIPVPWIEARDVSNAVLFLASDESRYVTGCALTVDCGATIKYPGT